MNSLARRYQQEEAASLGGLTVISGSVGLGMGEMFDTTKGEMVEAGTFNVIPVRHAHYVWTGSEGAMQEEPRPTGTRAATAPLEDSRG